MISKSKSQLASLTTAIIVVLGFLPCVAISAGTNDAWPDELSKSEFGLQRDISLFGETGPAERGDRNPDLTSRVFRLDYYTFAQAEASSSQPSEDDRLQRRSAVLVDMVTEDDIFDEDDAEESGDPSMDEVAEAINNPLGYLWALVLQYDVTWMEGSLSGGDKKIWHSYKFQPVMPFKLTKEWSVIARPVFQFNSFSVPDYSHREGLQWDRETGLGDTVLMLPLSKWTEPPFVFGLGPTFIFPSATDNDLGSEKWSAGPAMILAWLGEEWIGAVVAQHWWSYAGDGDRDQVNLTDLQYVLQYRMTNTFNVGCGPNIQYNWDTDELSLPIGLGGNELVMLGPLPVKVGLELQYYLKQPDDFGPEWNLRIIIVPVVPSPNWAKTPLLGG